MNTSPDMLLLMYFLNDFYLFLHVMNRVLNERHQMKATQNNYELDSHAQQKTRGKSMAGKSEAASVVMAAEGEGAVDIDFVDDDDNDMII